MHRVGCKEHPFNTKTTQERALEIEEREYGCEHREAKPIQNIKKTYTTPIRSHGHSR